MNFYADKLRKPRKQKGITIEELASQIEHLYQIGNEDFKHHPKKE